MSITLAPDQQEWINARIANGEFESIEQAVRQLVDERIAELSLEEDDLSWAKPLVDEALAQVERGEVLTGEEHHARIMALLASLKD